MKRVTGLMLVCALVMAVSGLAHAGQKVIGFSNRTMNGTYFAALSDAMQKEGDKAGYKMIITDAQTNFTKQISDVEDMLTQGVDYLLLNPQDPKAGLQIVKRANAAGVPVIIIDSGLDDSANVLTRIASSNVEGNILIGEYAAEITAGTPVKLALVSFMQGNMACQDRRVGFITGFVEKSLRDAGSVNLDIVMQTWALGTDEGGLKCMEDILVAHPEVNAVYTETSLQLKGMINAIRAAGRSDVKVFSFDGAKFEYDAIKKGQIMATAENSPRKIVLTALDVIKRYENGERTFPNNMSPKAVMVNKQNVEAVYDDGF